MAVALTLAAIGEAQWAAAEERTATVLPEQRRALVLPAATVVSTPGTKRQTDDEIEDVTSALDAVMSDAAQDLGFVLDLRPKEAADPNEASLVAKATALGVHVIAPSIERRSSSSFTLRLLVARPGQRVIRLRAENVSAEAAPIRAVVMLRDLARDDDKAPCAEPFAPYAPLRLASAPRSAGKSVLAANASIYGGILGYTIQRSAGSEDPRLLYPLLAVGAGIGLGGAILASEEWDVGLGDAWYLSAGATWPSLAAHLIYEGRFNRPDNPYGERWTFGLVGGLTGVSLATAGLTLGGMSEGGAALAHSGGFAGGLLGALLEIGYRGDVTRTPLNGAGYGAFIGWLGASALATQWAPPPSRVVSTDLGAVLGGLAGAALTSPLLLDPTPARTHGWAGATAASAIVGGVVGYRFGSPSTSPSATAQALRRAIPAPAVIGESSRGDARAPIVGLSWSGTLR